MVLQDFVNRVKAVESVRIYGAGKFANILYAFLKRKNITVDCFIVESKKNNADSLDGIPVMALEELEYQQLKNIVIALENKDVRAQVFKNLICQNAYNVILLSQQLIDEIYCNCVVDEDNLESFYQQLKAIPKIYAVVNDRNGIIRVEAMLERKLPITKVVSTYNEFKTNIDLGISILSMEELQEQEKDAVLLMTMNDMYFQRSFITAFKKLGFEKVIIVSWQLLNEIYEDYRKALWERDGSQFYFVNTSDIEQNHYVVQRNYNQRLYRFRICDKTTYTHLNEVKSDICSDKIVEEYDRNYPVYDYIPCKMTELKDVEQTGKKIEVYVVQSHVDKGVNNIKLPEWIYSLQVGKILTEQRIAKLCDNTGIHISEKNRDYSEGTGMYWIWKNTSGQDYVGLFHYRRHMALSEDFLEKLDNYDMALTIPVYMPVSIRQFFYESFLPPFDWELMYRFIKEYSEDYYQTALKYEQGHIYFACNIFIMKRHYFDEMCDFVFNVVESVDQYYKERGILREDRYAGFLIENLVSIYVMHHAKTLKIACTDMKFYIRGK